MRILYVTTVGMTMGFFNSFIKELLDEGCTVDIAANEADSKVPECYRQWGCKVYGISCQRSPVRKENLDAIRQIRKIVKDNHYNLVHCHTPIAAMCTRLACRPLQKNGIKVFYTAHGFHFYKGAPKLNWLVYYPIEMICSYMTDVLITINKEDYNLAKQKFHAGKVEYVPGVGIDTGKFGGTQADREKKREELGIPADAVLLLSVGELNKNKNHGMVIRALAKLNDNRIHYAIAGKGPLKESYEKMAKDCGISKQVHILGFRNDIPDLYCAADICVFPSIREGLGLAAVEGMASGLPLIVSDNRGTRGFLNEDMAITCTNSDVVKFAEAIEKLQSDMDLRMRMGKLNKEKSSEFDISRVNGIMHKLYDDL